MKKISGLYSAISSERTSAASQLSAARTRCAEARRVREDAIKEQYEAKQDGRNKVRSTNLAYGVPGDAQP